MTGLLKRLPRRIGELLYNRQPKYSPEILNLPLHLPGLISIIDPETGKPRLVTGGPEDFPGLGNMPAYSQGEGTFEQVKAPTGRYERTGTKKVPSKLTQGLLEGLERAIAGAATPNIAGGGATDIFRSLAAGQAAVDARNLTRADLEDKRERTEIERLRAEGELLMRKAGLLNQEEQLERMKASGRPSLRDAYLAAGRQILDLRTGKPVELPGEPTVPIKAEVASKYGYAGTPDENGNVQIPVSLADNIFTGEGRPPSKQAESPAEATIRRTEEADELGLKGPTRINWIAGKKIAPEPHLQPATLNPAQAAEVQTMHETNVKSLKGLWDEHNWAQYFDVDTEGKPYVKEEMKTAYYKARADELKSRKEAETKYSEVTGRATKKPSLAKNVDKEVTDHRDEFLQDLGLLPRKDIGAKPNEETPTWESYKKNLLEKEQGARRPMRRLLVPPIPFR